MPRKTRKKQAKANEWHERFLKALKASGGIVRYACEASKVDKTTVYRHRNQNPEFAAAMRVAEEDGADDLERIAQERAKAGSDVLLIFLLKGAKPWKYRENLKIEQDVSAKLQIVEEIVDDDADKNDPTPQSAESIPPL